MLAALCPGSPLSQPRPRISGHARPIPRWSAAAPKITLSLDPQKSQEETRAYLSWGPYRRQDGKWQSYPIQEYWDQMDVRFEDIFDELQGRPRL